MKSTNALVKETAMSNFKRADCISVLKAQEQLKVARNTLESYINALAVTKHKFPLDTKVYITKTDFERIQQLKSELDEQ